MNKAEVSDLLDLALAKLSMRYRIIRQAFAFVYLLRDGYYTFRDSILLAGRLT